MAVAHGGGLTRDPKLDGTTETTPLILILARHSCSPLGEIARDERYLGRPGLGENGCASDRHYRKPELDSAPARRYSAGATPTQRLKARLSAASDP